MIRYSEKEKTRSLDGDDYCYHDDLPPRHVRDITVRQASSGLVHRTQVSCQASECTSGRQQLLHVGKASALRKPWHFQIIVKISSGNGNSHNSVAGTDVNRSSNILPAHLTVTGGAQLDGCSAAHKNHKLTTKHLTREGARKDDM